MIKIGHLDIGSSWEAQKQTLSVCGICAWDQCFFQIVVFQWTIVKKKDFLSANGLKLGQNLLYIYI